MFSDVDAEEDVPESYRKLLRDFLVHMAISNTISPIHDEDSGEVFFALLCALSGVLCLCNFSLLVRVIASWLCTYAFSYSMYVCMCMCMYVCMYVCICVYICVCTYACICVCTGVSMLTSDYFAYLRTLLFARVVCAVAPLSDGLPGFFAR